jgi:drug/metabolite transporter (DMT)-like permease
MGSSDAPPARGDGPSVVAQAPASFTLAEAFWFCTFSISNIGINYFNSWALKADQAPGFHFAMFYTMFHMIFSACAALVLMLTCVRPEAGLPSWAQFCEARWSIAAISTCTVVAYGFNNLSLTMVPLFANQIIKATQPLPVAVFSYLLAGKTYGVGVQVSVGFIIVGSALASFHYLTVGEDSGAPTSFLGLVLCVIAAVAAALKPVVAMMAMRGADGKARIEPTPLLFYDAALSGVTFLIIWLCSPAERVGMAAYLGDSATTTLGIGIIFAGASIAFVFNIAYYFFTHLTTALTATVGSNGVKVITIVLAAIQSGVHDAASWVGIVLVVASIGTYSYFTQGDREQQQQQQAEPHPAAADAVQRDGSRRAAEATEKTPLTASLKSV